MRRSLWLVTAVLVTAAAAGCGGSSDAESATTEAPVATTAASTTAAAPQSVVEASFEETGCVFTGPSQIAAGDHVFVLTNNTELAVGDLLVGVLNDHTYEELHELQPWGGEWEPWPGGSASWPLATKGFERLERELAENQSADSYVLEPGDHFVFVTMEYPAGYWYCGPLEVIP